MSWHVSVFLNCQRNRVKHLVWDRPQLFAVLQATGEGHVRAGAESEGLAAGSSVLR